jgi:hypothetical protein
VIAPLQVYAIIIKWGKVAKWLVGSAIPPLGKDGSITYGEYTSFGATVDGKIIVDISTPAINGVSVGSTIYINIEQLKIDFIRSLNTVIDGFENLNRSSTMGAGAGSYELSPYFY